MKKIVGALLITAVVAGCPRREQQGFVWVGQDTMTGRQVNAHQGPMPSGETYTGFFRSTLLGDINLQQTGDAVIGDYEYDRGSCHVLGHLEGTTTGNLLRFSFREDKRQCGYPTPVVGRGFFLMETSQEGEVHRVHVYGQIGLGDSDRGDGEVSAIKVPNREPVLRSQQTNTEGSGEGDTSGSGSGSGSGS
jgi:hypothetical protein